MNIVRWLPSRSTVLNNITGHPRSNNNARWRVVTSGFVESYKDTCRAFYGIAPNLLKTACSSKVV